MGLAWSVPKGSVEPALLLLEASFGLPILRRREVTTVFCETGCATETIQVFPARIGASRPGRGVAESCTDLRCCLIVAASSVLHLPQQGVYSKYPCTSSQVRAPALRAVATMRSVIPLQLHTYIDLMTSPNTIVVLC